MTIFFDKSFLFEEIASGAIRNSRVDDTFDSVRVQVSNRQTIDTTPAFR